MQGRKPIGFGYRVQGAGCRVKGQSDVAIGVLLNFFTGNEIEGSGSGDV